MSQSVASARLLCILTAFSLVPLNFFFSGSGSTEIYTLSLHDALPISTATRHPDRTRKQPMPMRCAATAWPPSWAIDRKSTRLNSSHANISYAVFCLKKKNYALERVRRLVASADEEAEDGDNTTASALL